MDFSFFYDPAEGLARAEFSMGHEALGRWLTEEMGTCPERLEKVLEAVARLEEGRCAHWRLEGGELSLELTREEAWVGAHVLLQSGPETLWLEESQWALYEQESRCGCGLEDFRQVLESWQAFLKERAPRRRLL